MFISLQWFVFFAWQLFQRLLYLFNSSKNKNCQMKKNMGTTDKIIRLIVAAIFAALYFTNTVTGTIGIVLLVLAGIFVLTSLISVCPLYSMFGISSCPVEKKQ